MQFMLSTLESAFEIYTIDLMIILLLGLNGRPLLFIRMSKSNNLELGRLKVMKNVKTQLG